MENKKDESRPNQDGFSKMKIISNKHNVCPVCNSEEIEIYDTDNGDGCFIEKWSCPDCKCSGKQYFEFSDHYEVYAENDETRIDRENDDCFPYMRRERLNTLLENAMSVILENMDLHGLRNAIGISPEEYDAVINSNLINIEALSERLEQFIGERAKSNNPIDKDIIAVLRTKLNELTPLQLQVLSVGRCNKLLECGYFCGDYGVRLCKTAKVYKTLALEHSRRSNE